jgi:aldose 1-epimerase
MRHTLTATVHDGYPSLTLACPEAAVSAAFVPGAGMVACSLQHRGAELLGQRRGLRAYAAHGSTMGIPLLHPWANRLRGLAYTAGGRSVILDPASPRLHRDAAGLPMHGLVLGYPHWIVTAQSADDDGARVSARLDFAADPPLLAAFPFPHTLTLAAALREAALTITTTLQPTGPDAVPVSFGFHPYLQLPGIPRERWHVEIPMARRLLLDAHGIPTGETEAVAIEPGQLGDRTFDDLFTDLEPPCRFVLAGGGRRLAVEFDAGYPFAQVYAPDSDAVICFEPMTAPTNALVSGGPALRFVSPGASFHAAFTIRIT